MGGMKKCLESQRKKEKKEAEQYLVGSLLENTLINDSKLPLNNLTLKTERGLARRVPVWFLKYLEYKECIRNS